MDFQKTKSINNPKNNIPIVLLRPPVSISTSTWHISNAPPLGLAYLSGALIQEGLNIKVIDALGEGLENYGPTKNSRIYFRGLSEKEIIKKIPKNSEVIMITCMFSIDWNHIAQIIKKIKVSFPKIIILLGGEHVSAIPEYILRSHKEVDYCCVGEGDNFVKEFFEKFFNHEDVSSINGLAYRKGNEIIINPPYPRIKDVDSLPWPAWELFPLENYLSADIAAGIGLGRTMAMLATRGCPYECTFCSNKNMWGTNYYARSPDEIIQEIKFYKKNYNITGIEFHDLTIFVGKKWIMDFCSKFLEHKINLDWTVTIGTRSEGLDRESLTILKKTGCKYICFAPESGSERMLTYSKKRLNLDKIFNSIKINSEIGLLSKINIIIGFPDETRIDIYKSFLFLWKSAAAGVNDIGLSIFYPYPGSKMFNELIKEDQIILGTKFFDELFNWEILRFRKHYCKKVYSWELTLYKFFGMATFYLLSYVLFPKRIVLLIRNFSQKTYTSRLEKFLYGIFIKKDTFYKKISIEKKRIG